MSRSYKHTPRGGQKKDKFFKNYANRKLRRNKLSHDLRHGDYKKASCSWNICDYETVGLTFNDYWNCEVCWWHTSGRQRNEPYPDKEQALKDYKRWYIRK